MPCAAPTPNASAARCPACTPQQFDVLPDDDDAPRRPRLLIGAVVAAGAGAGRRAGLELPRRLGAAAEADRCRAQVRADAAPVVVAPAPPVALPPALPAPAPMAAARERGERRAGAGRRRRRADGRGAPTAASRNARRRRRRPQRRAAPRAAPDDRIYSAGRAARGDPARAAQAHLSAAPATAATRRAGWRFLNGQVFHEGDTSPPAWS